MKDYIAEHHETILKILGAGIILWIVNRVAKIFKGPDGKFSVVEFGKFVGFWTFLFLAIYMIYKEGSRQHEWHLYDALYITIVFGSLLTVLHLDYALDKFVKILELMVKIRTKTPLTPEVKKEEEIIN